MHTEITLAPNMATCRADAALGVTSSVSVERHCAELDDVLVGLETVSRRITERLMCQLRECSPVVGDRVRMLLSIVPTIESLWNRCRDQHYSQGACDTL